MAFIFIIIFLHVIIIKWDKLFNEKTVDSNLSIPQEFVFVKFETKSSGSFLRTTGDIIIYVWYGNKKIQKNIWSCQFTSVEDVSNVDIQPEVLCWNKQFFIELQNSFLIVYEKDRVDSKMSSIIAKIAINPSIRTLKFGIPSEIYRIKV